MSPLSILEISVFEKILRQDRWLSFIYLFLIISCMIWKIQIQNLLHIQLFYEIYHRLEPYEHHFNFVRLTIYCSDLWTKLPYSNNISGLGKSITKWLPNSCLLWYTLKRSCQMIELLPLYFHFFLSLIKFQFVYYLAQSYSSLFFNSVNLFFLQETICSRICLPSKKFLWLTKAAVSFNYIFKAHVIVDT